MKLLIALAGLALATPAFAQNCPCGPACACPAGVCPAGCPLSPVQAFLPVPGSAKLAAPCPGGVCPVAAKAPVIASAGASHSAAFFVTGGHPHPVAAALGHPLGRLRSFVAAHRPHLFGGCR